MTNQRAEQVATMLLTAAAVGAVVCVVKTPALRRLVWRFAVTAATSTLPAWINQEVRHAWSETSRSEL